MRTSKPILILILCIIRVTWMIYAQPPATKWDTVKVDWQYKDHPLSAVLKEIITRHNIPLLFSEKLVADQNVSYQCRSKLLIPALREMLEPLPLELKIISQQQWILIAKNAPPIPISPPRDSKGSIHGKIYDLKTREALPFANIILKNTRWGAISDADGFFRIVGVPYGSYRLSVSFIGYQPYILTLELDEKERQLMIGLEEITIQEEEIVVYGDVAVSKEAVNIGRTNLSPKIIKVLPSLGETDVMRALQYMPGVQTANHLSSEFHVRGGKSDENLILLDGIPIHNPYHLGSVFSTFDANAMRVVELKSGSFESEYGGRMSSVLNMISRDGKMDQLHANFQLSLISARLHVEGPLNSRASFMLSLRRTYIDKLLAIFSDSGQIPYYFFDGIAKVTYRLSDNHELRFNSFLGRDFLKNESNFGDEDDFNLDWGNATAGLNWKYIASATTFWETSLNFSRFSFDFKSDPRLILANLIDDAFIKTSRSSYFTEKWLNKIGIEAHTIKLYFHINLQENEIKNYTKEVQDYSFFFQTNYTLWQNLLLEGGMRINYFSYNQNLNWEPRGAIRWQIGPRWNLKAGGGIFSQNFTALNDEGAILRIFNVWDPIESPHPSQQCWQLLVGIEHKHQALLASFETYYKRYPKLAVRNQYQLYDDENALQFQKGETYGFDVSAKYESNRWFAMSVYTLAWVVRVDKDGNTYFPDFDQRHSLKCSGGWHFSQSGRLTLTGIYFSGQLQHQLLGKYYKHDIAIMPEAMVIAYPNYKRRLPANKRIDVNLYWEWDHWEFFVQILNIFNFKNYIYYDSGNQKGGSLPIIPSLGVVYKF